MDRKTDKVKQEHKPRDDGVELENQFIMRLPEEPAKILQEALQTGNLKDRLAIKMDNDLRYGEVRFDCWLLHAKIVDLPTVIECHKTIDSKNFYKSADICQMMICKLEPDPIDTEKESPNKAKKKDPNKVDKKYLWPHGITPPCKNVRKRRFRKTLKKKNVEAPEIEKEVKRLLRIDNDAVKVDYEIINEDIDKPMLDASSKEYNEDEFNEDTTNNDGDEKPAQNDSSQKDINIESDDEDAPSRSATNMHGGVGEHDIFGEEVSSSGDDDDERQDETRRSQENEESSRLSADDSRMSDFSMGVGASGGGEVGNESRADESSFQQSTKDEPIEFNKSMFTNIPKLFPDNDKSNSNFGDSNSNMAGTSGFFSERKLHSSSNFKDEFEFSYDAPSLNGEEIKLKISELRRQYEDLKMQQAQKQREISSIQNPTLRQRMQETLDNLRSQMVEKDLEIKDYENML